MRECPELASPVQCAKESEAVKAAVKKGEEVLHDIQDCLYRYCLLIDWG
jgi:hypothetical protein